MYHSITFGTVSAGSNGYSTMAGKNTWDDWHLIPSSRPSVALPEPNTNYVDIPFRDGSLDISEAVTGYMTYKDRSGSWEFYIANDYHNWVELKQEITNYLHGRKMFVVLEDDPTFFYEGRLKVDEFRSQKVNSTITIGYVLKPYKRLLDWIWDTFNFETDSTTDVVECSCPGVAEIIGGRMRATPLITTEASGITVSLNGGDDVLLLPGQNRMAGMILQEGENTLEFKGNQGTVHISYVRGEL